MIKTITPNHLILLAYNELPPHERTIVINKVKKDKKLLAQYNQLLKDLELLDTVSYSPNPTSIKIVLEESQLSTLEAI